MADLSQYDPVFQAAGAEWNVDPQLLKAMAAQESGGNRNAQSKAGAQGVMQIIPATQKYLGVSDPHDPVQSIYGGAKYMAEALDAEKSPEDALRYYHGGKDWRDNFGPESKAYAPAVTAHYVRLANGRQYAQASNVATDASSAKDSSSAPSDEDFLKATGAVAGAGADDAAFLARTGAKVGPPDGPTPPIANDEPNPLLRTDPSIAQMPYDPTTVQKVGAGLVRAGHDITDYPAELLARGANAVGLTNLLNQAGVPAPTPAQTTAADTAGRQAFQRDYGDSTIATGARIGGQIAGTLPLLAAGGGILGAAGDVVAAGAGRIAPLAGRAIEAGTTFLSGGTQGNLLTRGASLAAQGAMQGGAAGALLSGQSDQSIGAQTLAGAAVGGVAGPVAGAIGAGANALLGRSGGASPEIAQLAQLAREKYGIPITAPQMTSNSLLRIASDQSAKAPFSGAGKALAAQQTAWQRAVSNTFGEDAPLVTPEVMSRAATRIGGMFNDVAKRTTIEADDALMGGLGRIQAEASQTLPTGEFAPINTQLTNVLDAAAKGDGQISGEVYQALTRANAPLGRASQSADPNVRFYARQIRDELDNAFERSATPVDQAALKTARGQYRAMKTIEDLVEKSPDGNLSPALLMGQVRGASSRFDSSTGGMAYTGGGALGDLARIGQLFLKQPPNSGTADRAAINNALGFGGASLGLANPLLLGTVPAGLTANRGVNAYLRSGGLANRLAESSLNPPAFVPSRTARVLAPAAAIGSNALRQ